MRHKTVETGVKVTLATQLQRTWGKHVCILGLLGRQNFMLNEDT